MMYMCGVREKLRSILNFIRIIITRMQRGRKQHNKHMRIYLEFSR